MSGRRTVLGLVVGLAFPAGVLLAQAPSRPPQTHGASVTAMAVTDGAGGPCVATEPASGMKGPARHTICTATSSDGLVWVHDDRIVAKQASVPTAVVTAIGTLRVFFVQAAGGPERLSCLESFDAGWSFAPIACSLTGLEPGTRPLDPSVVRLPDGRYRLYYYAARGEVNSQTPHDVDRAISTDGLTFTREGTSLRYDGLVDPDVWWTGRDWFLHVWTNSARSTIVARSGDGTSFTQVGTTGLPGGSTAPVRMDDGRFRMFAFDTSESAIWSYVSKDGRTWTKEPGERLRARPGQGIADPYVVRLADGTWKMLYRTSPPGEHHAAPR